jgi:hypothetical protein
LLLTISDMPDPKGIYASVIGNADFSKTYVDIPDVCDGHGVLITPADYEKKLYSGMIVMVNVLLKLFVVHIYLYPT